MNNYIDYFRTEAKLLLSSYRNKDPEAIERCRKIFGDRLDLSLMNMQHVIAQENGYKKWNDLVQDGSDQVAEKLATIKSNTMTNHFTKWFDNRYELVDHENKDQQNSKLNASEKFLTSRKNPGLGIQELHNQGYLGKGMTIAFVESAGLGDHIEYHDSLIDFLDVSEKPVVGTPRANDFVSAIVGKTCGVAPKAQCYFISAYTDTRLDATVLIKGIQKAIELHEKLVASGKKGIDVIATRSGCSERSKEYEEFVKIIDQATAKGICVMTAKGVLDVNKHGYYQVGVDCPKDKNPDDTKGYIISEPWEGMKDLLDLDAQNSVFQRTQKRVLYFPSGCRTCASCRKANGYDFESSVPSIVSYVAGLYLLCKAIKTDLKPLDFYRLCFESGDAWKYYGRIVNPTRLMTLIKNM